MTTQREELPPHCAMRWKRRLADDHDLHVKKIQNMNVRDDDIFLCSFPKSGTHWVWRIIDMIVNKTSEYSHRMVDAGFIDQQRVDHVDNLESPRVMSTHLPLTSLPSQVKARGTKIVHVYRDPKAVTVSLYFQWKNSGKVPDLTMEKVVETFNTEKGPHKSWFHWMDKVAEFERSHPNAPIFHVSYEELKLHPVDTIHKMASFLDVSISRNLCQEIAEAVSFSKQREEEHKRAGPKDTHMAKFEKIFYRKGEISDWKNHLTVAQREKLDKAVKDRAHRCPFSARYVATGDN